MTPRTATLSSCAKRRIPLILGRGSCVVFATQDDSSYRHPVILREAQDPLNFWGSFVVFATQDDSSDHPVILREAKDPPVSGRGS